jgi:hypothetical protein
MSAVSDRILVSRLIKVINLVKERLGLKMTNTIYNEIAQEFGSSALSINNPQPEISIKRAAQLINEMGFDVAMEYVKAGGR